MSVQHNDIVNKKKESNANVNDNENIKGIREKQVDLIAINVMEKLQAGEDSRLWYYKLCWKLPENVIYNNLETALKGNNPQKYFTWLCKRSMYGDTK